MFSRPGSILTHNCVLCQELRGVLKGHTSTWEIRSLTVCLRCLPTIFLPIMLTGSAEPFPTEAGARQPAMVSLVL